MKKISQSCYFSVSSDLVVLNEALPYDLYINSSGNSKRERFVKVFPSGDILELEDVATFKKKYHQLYIAEAQRSAYLKSLVKNEKADPVEKTQVIKDSAIHYLNKVFDKDKEFTTEVLGEAIAGCHDSVECMLDVINDYNVDEVQNLIASLSFHDFYTFDHSINVSMYSMSIFKEVSPNADRNEIIMAGLGGLLHDLGKIKIPTHIINNSGKLSDEEFGVIKKHPGFGGELLDMNKMVFDGVNFATVRRVIMEHHENFNGTGYPKGLQGEEIHIFARVTAIADFFDAITTKRSYHEALSMEDSIAVMEKTVGKKIDPEIFTIFKDNVAQIAAKKINKMLPEDFDPCQPHDKLPFKPIPINFDKKDSDNKLAAGDKEKEDFGKVKSDGIFGDNKKEAS